jgi:hypothetical protein
MRYPLLFFTSFLLLLFGQPLQAQIVINEVCSYNGSVIEDEDAKHPDWIELYNAGSSDVSLFGYCICGKDDDIWYFPAVNIGSHGYLLIFASGKNRKTYELHTTFSLSKDGDNIKLFNPSGILIDEFLLESLQLNHSYGRYPDGNSNICLFNCPSPCLSNNSSDCFHGYVANPYFSLRSGFYKGKQNLSLACITKDSEIRYTSDGSIPTKESKLYTSAINIGNSKVIRARGFGDSTLLTSSVITNTFIINYSSSLAVFCVSTDPNNLWDEDSGIYVKGPNADSVYPYYGANYWQDWEVPAHVEFFESDHREVFEQDIGLSINGGSVSRTRPMKALRFSCRGKYGYPEFNYRFFGEKALSRFRILVLRNSGGDYNRAHFRDGSLHQHMIIGGLDIDLLSYRPCVVFLNGEYWGVHNIREKFSKHYLAENHGVDPENIDLLEEDSTFIHGDFTAFNAMDDFITTNPMIVPTNYDSVKKMLDISSFCDYMIAETFLSNIDWPYNNIKYWRERKIGSKWRYMLMDLDISLGNMGWAPAELDELGKVLGPYGYENKHMRILKSLLRNTEFRYYFINRYADIVNTLFTKESLYNHIGSVISLLEPEMPAHFERWGDNMERWYKEINNAVNPYMDDRPGYSLQYVRDTFRLEKEVSITLDVFPPDAGKISINTINPHPLPWKGIYFDGVPINITAKANPGYSFYQWKSEHVHIIDSTSARLNLNVDNDNVFTALFISTALDDNLIVFPNPAKDVLNVGFVSESNSIGSISVFDPSGKEHISLENKTFSKGVNHIKINTHSLMSGIYFLFLDSGHEILNRKFVKIE